MPFGQGSEITQTNRIRQWALKQVRINEEWVDQWQWLVDEYKDLRDELKIAYKKPEFIDPRNAKPVPDTTNHVYGWLVNKPEFQLEKFGPDVQPAPPLPEFYKIMK